MQRRFTFCLCLLLVALVGTLHAQPSPAVYSRLYSFQPTEGHSPSGPLVETSPRTFVGASRLGAANQLGGLYTVNANGSHSLLYSFSEADGYRLASNGGLVPGGETYYGTNDIGGLYGHGTIFRYSAVGGFSVLHNFNGEDGSAPNDLERGKDGYFYGTSRRGGVATIPAIRDPSPGSGTIFKINSIGQLSTLHVFHPYIGFGETSPRAGLLRSVDGLFYGSTLTSVPSDLFGTAFTISESGLYTPGGAFFNAGTPIDKFAQADDGTIYGVYPSGAGGLANVYGSLFKVPYSIFSGELQFFPQEAGGPRSVTTGADGIVYITTSNRIYSFRANQGLTLLHDFGSAVTEVHRLLLASDGNLYGATSGGGAYGLGEVFQIRLREPTPTPVPAVSATSTPLPLNTLAAPVPTVTPPSAATAPVPLPTNGPPVIASASCSFSRSNKKPILNCVASVSDDSAVESVSLVLRNRRPVKLNLSGDVYSLRISTPFLNENKRFLARVIAIDNAGLKSFLTFIGPSAPKQNLKSPLKPGKGRNVVKSTFSS